MNLDYFRYTIKKHVTKSGFQLVYFENCSAGGETHNDSVIEIILRTGKKSYQHAHEWCCGHGAHGFEILNRGICQELSLSDKFLPAVVSCEFTAAINDVSDKVSVFQIEEFSSLPEHLKIDLLVADPPHYDTSCQLSTLNEDALRQVIDCNYQSHQIFFDNASKYLTKDADIYLLEKKGIFKSRLDIFDKMINDANMTICGTYATEFDYSELHHLKFLP